jgi:hypothetical protein
LSAALASGDDLKVLYDKPAKGDISTNEWPVMPGGVDFQQVRLASGCVDHHIPARAPNL